MAIISSAFAMRLSPLAEGRELKCNHLQRIRHALLSPLAEGRELKCFAFQMQKIPLVGRPSRRGVN